MKIPFIYIFSHKNANYFFFKIEGNLIQFKDDATVHIIICMTVNQILDYAGFLCDFMR